METGRTRYEEYRICQERGHQPSDVQTASVSPQDICQWCGTHYWTETSSVLKEVMVPESEPEGDDGG